MREVRRAAARNMLLQCAALHHHSPSPQAGPAHLGGGEGGGLGGGGLGGGDGGGLQAGQVRIGGSPAGSLLPCWLMQACCGPGHACQRLAAVVEPRTSAIMPAPCIVAHCVPAGGARSTAAVVHGAWAEASPSRLTWEEATAGGWGEAAREAAWGAGCGQRRGAAACELLHAMLCHQPALDTTTGLQKRHANQQDAAWANSGRGPGAILLAPNGCTQQWLHTWEVAKEAAGAEAGVEADLEAAMAAAAAAWVG